MLGVCALGLGLSGFTDFVGFLRAFMLDGTLFGCFGFWGFEDPNAQTWPNSGSPNPEPETRAGECKCLGVWACSALSLGVEFRGDYDLGFRV